MKAGIALILLAIVSRAGAAEPIRFQVPAGWTLDPGEAKSRQAEVYAADTRTQPAVEMTGMRAPAPMFADDASVRGFLKGLRKTMPGLVEIKHDFLDIAGMHSARVVIDVDSEGEKYRQVYYLMPAGAETACLLFTMARAGLDARLAEFDAIARTTRGLAPPKRPGSN
jgi:hypothetical protein